MKKFISLLIISGMLSGQIVYAADMEISCNKEKVTVTAQLSPDSYGFLITSRKDEDINNNNNVCAVLEQKSDDKGNIEFTFDMPEQKNGIPSDGVYEVSLKEEDGSISKKTFEYAAETSKSALIAKIRAAASAEDLKNIILAEENKIVLGAIGISVEAYNSLKDNDKTAAAEEFNSSKASASAEEDIKDLFNSITAIKGINESGDDITLYLKAANLKDMDGKRYMTVTDNEKKKQIASYIKSNRPYSSTDALQKAYHQIDALYAVNNAKFDQIEGLFEKYVDVLELNGNAAYRTYKNASNKSEVNKELLRLIKRSMPQTLSQLTSYLNQAVSSKASSGSNGSSGGGGGSSSGGSTRRNESGTSISNVLPMYNGDTKTEKTPAFNDMDNYAWAKEAVERLKDEGVISGDGTGAFDGNKEMTREEFVTMLVKAAKVYDPVAIYTLYDDVKESDWFYRAVASARQAKIAEGISDTEFGIGKKITRQDLVTMAYRAAKDEIPERTREYVSFEDDDLIADYARNAIYDLYMSEVVNGMENNRFEPYGNATKAQGAQIIYGLFYKGKGESK